MTAPDREQWERSHAADLVRAADDIAADVRLLQVTAESGQWAESLAHARDLHRWSLAALEAALLLVAAERVGGS